jgi:adenine specific DNA methylase Mod
MTRKNQLYYGDNLEVLRRYVRDESVDLVYLDPPFNSRQDYNVLFAEKDGSRSSSQIHAFEDTWEWNHDSQRAYEEIVEAGGRVADAMRAFHTFLGNSDMMAYLAMMAPRLVELRRVLKETGSIYLHCDPTASHYLKILMDAVFGPQFFQNEIIWKRTSAHSSAERYGPVHDVLLFFSKSCVVKWNSQYTGYDDSYIKNFYRHKDENGRIYRLSDLTGAGVRHGETGLSWRGIDVTSKGRHWMVPPAELEILDTKGRIYWPKKRGGAYLLTSDIWMRCPVHRYKTFSQIFLQLVLKPKSVSVIPHKSRRRCWNAS